MITICTGCPGSGKTLFAMSKVADALECGQDVYIFQGDFPFSEPFRHPHLHLLDDRQASVFWRHVQPGSLIVFEEFYPFLKDISRDDFFCCWFDEHHFAGTDMLITTQHLQPVASFFLHRVSEPSAYKAVNPDIIFDFQHLSFYGARGFRIVRHSAVDSSYVYFGHEPADPVFRSHFLARRFIRLSVLSKKISRFFNLEASK
jgi:hypothetical protein